MSDPLNPGMRSATAISGAGAPALSDSLDERSDEDTLAHRVLNTGMTLLYFLALTAAANSLSVFYVPYSIVPVFDLSRAFVSFVFLGSIVIHARVTNRSTFDLAMFILFLLTYVPIATVWTLGYGDSSWVYAQSAFWLALFWGLRIAPWRAEVPSVVGGRILAVALAGLCLAYSFGALVASFGIPSGFNFADFLWGDDRRLEFKASGIPFINYTLTWCMYAIVPMIFFMARGMAKIPIYIGLAVLVIYAFLVTGHKIYLFILPLVASFVWLSRRPMNSVICAAGLLFIVLAGWCIAIASGDRIVYGVSVNRGLILPAKISFQYFEFFSYYGPVSLAHSVLSGASDYIWSDTPARVIGSVFYNVKNNANTGILGDAFANFGFMGLVLLLPALLALRGLVDGVTSRSHRSVTQASVIIPMLVWVNIPFLTSLLTGGLAIGILFAWLNCNGSDPVIQKKQ